MARTGRLGTRWSQLGLFELGKVEIIGATGDASDQGPEIAGALVQTITSTGSVEGPVGSLDGQAALVIGATGSVEGQVGELAGQATETIGASGSVEGPAGEIGGDLATSGNVGAVSDGGPAISGELTVTLPEPEPVPSGSYILPYHPPRIECRGAVEDGGPSVQGRLWLVIGASGDVRLAAGEVGGTLGYDAWIEREVEWILGLVGDEALQPV